MRAPHNPWLISNSTTPFPRLRLFCFPYAGGGASIYRNWANELPSWIEVNAVQLPGRETRWGEKRYTHLTKLVPVLAEEILPFIEDLPFAFFGHSMGALLSFELARYLQRFYSVVPKYLFVSSRFAPQTTIQNKSRTKIAELDDTEFMEIIREQNGTPVQVLENTELMQIMIPLLRDDFQLCDNYIYQPGPPLDCPIMALAGNKEVDLTEQTLCQWQVETTNSFKMVFLEGDHFYLRSSEGKLLEILSAEINSFYQ